MDCARNERIPHCFVPSRLFVRRHDMDNVDDRCNRNHNGCKGSDEWNRIHIPHCCVVSSWNGCVWHVCIGHTSNHSECASQRDSKRRQQESCTHVGSPTHQWRNGDHVVHHFPQQCFDRNDHQCVAICNIGCGWQHGDLYINACLY